MQPNNQQNETGWTFGNDGAPPDQPNPQAQIQEVTWTGSEFIEQHKNIGWYVVLGVAIFGFCAIIYLLSKDLWSIGFIAVMGILFAIIASRKPKQIPYRIDSQGVSIGVRNYTFNDFRSFSMQRDGAIGYINLMPLKRLMPEISIYYPPEEEQKIFDTLSFHIPHENHKETYFDKFSRFIRF